MLPGDVAAAEVCDTVAGVRACVAPGRGAELSSYQVWRVRACVPSLHRGDLNGSLYAIFRWLAPMVNGWNCCTMAMIMSRLWGRLIGLVEVRLCLLLTAIPSC